MLRRLANQARNRLSSDSHRGAKTWPTWLGDKTLDLPAGEPESLCLPAYTRGGQPPRTRIQPHAPSGLHPDDPESYFTRHRWSDCLSALLAGDDSAHRASQDALEWIGRGMPKSDRAWEPYSSCERVVNLAVLLAARPQCMDARHEPTVRKFFSESLEWISAHLEYYGAGRTNNHVLNNARALVVGGTAIRSGISIERGLVIFARMAPLLFQDHGFLRERSSHYQVIVTNWLLDAVHFARASPVMSNVARLARAQLEECSLRASRATSRLLSYLEGANTHIGDVSPDVHPQLSVERLRYLYPASLEPRPEPVSGQWDDWVFVSDGWQTLATCMPPRTHPVHYTTHGHDDLGGFVWLVDGRTVLVDAGRTRYLDGATTRFQVGPAGHNTVRINGLGPLAESLLLNGRWYPEPYASATVDCTVDGDRGFSLRHDGFSRLPDVGEHMRSVRLEQDALVIEDRVDGAGLVRLETLWHFAPDFAQTSLHHVAATDARLAVTVSHDAGGGSDPGYTWQTYPFAAAYGEEQPAPMLRLAWRVPLPCSIRTVLNVTRCVA
jgi:hypothetical protein